jgi:AcrR family transcriptional regulator
LTARAASKALSHRASADGTRGPAERARRDEILDTAAAIFAGSGYARTSLKDVADACGILPGSLYHHFASKEAIVVELLARYWVELDQVGAEGKAVLGRPDGPPLYQQILTLGTAVAECSVRNRAAVQLTMFEPHAGAGDELVKLTQRQPVGVQRVMHGVLRKGQATGVVKPDVDIDSLTDELVRTMGHVGIGMLHRKGDVRQIALTLCHLMLDGGAARAPADRTLDRSKAMRAAEAVIGRWAEPPAEEADTDVDERIAHLLGVARTEFARRGFEATTIRDIAAAAGMGTGSVYRFVESKQALLLLIMGSFQSKLSDGYASIVSTDSTAVEKLDALTWLNVNVLDRFPEEYEIQQSWLREIPPAESDQSTFHEERAKHIESVVAEGLRQGQLRAGHLGADAPPLAVLTGCFRDLIWPTPLVPKLGKRATLAYARSTMLRGAALRRGRGPAGVRVTA